MRIIDPRAATPLLSGPSSRTVKAAPSTTANTPRPTILPISACRKPTNVTIWEIHPVMDLQIANKQ